MADEDFEEEEVWAFVKERKDGSPKASRRSKDSSLSSSSNSKHAARMIPRSNAHIEETGRNLRQSAPVNIPDWSKIYRHKSSSECNDNADDDDDDGEDVDDKVPPHEWIAKKLSRSHISSFSVCEGAGRTLKGRDQRMMRNAVLTRTGFLE